MTPSYRFAAGLLRPLMRTITRQDWDGAQNLPRSGGFVVCPNHISYADPLTVAHFLFDNGQLPRFLIKDTLFQIPVLRSIFRGAGQIPVYRGTRDAQRAYSAAVDAVRAGECVVVYPEATLTRDPGLWPMRGKTGAARVALETGCPVIPVAQWGAQHVLAPYGKVPHLLPPRRVTVHAGKPVDLTRFSGRRLDGVLLQEATGVILDDLTRMLAEIRSESPPATRWNPRLHGQPATGNPKGRNR
ncbi:MAG: lysophospholipid acyltransferase family protein [Actinomycetes bacterium]